MAVQRPPKSPALAPDPEVLKYQISPPRFDLLTATGRGGATHEEFLHVIESALGPVKKVSAWGGNFYDHRLNLVKDGRTIGHLAWGGLDATCPKMEVHGTITPPVADELRRSMSGRYGVPVLHSCVDFRGGRATFLRMQALAEEVKKMKVRGKKPRGISRYDPDFPEDPWAYELGSKKSTYICFYEKGRESPEYGPDMVRAELRSRFKSAGKLMAAELDAHQAWGVTSFTQRLGAMLFDPTIGRHRCRSTAEKTQAERTIANGGRQYSKSVLAFMGMGHTTTELGELVYAAALTKQAIQNAKRKPYLLGGTNALQQEHDLLEQVVANR